MFENITDIDENQTTFHICFPQSAISSVRVLLLGHNRIHNLPRYGIEMLPNVRTIDLNHNIIG